MARLTSVSVQRIPTLTVGGCLGSLVQHRMAFISDGPATWPLIALGRVSLVASQRVFRRAPEWEQVSRWQVAGGSSLHPLGSRDNA